MNSARDAISVFTEGYMAVHPSVFIPPFLEKDNRGFRIGKSLYSNGDFRRIYVAAAGKAASAMALEVERIIGELVSEALVITKDDHSLPGSTWKVLEASHPVPDYRSVEAANALKDLASKAGEGDLFILLLSGGASALISDLPDGISLEELQTTFQLLLGSGAAIEELNTVRKHLSLLKGGQLAGVVYPAKLECILLSDVPGDDPAVIASGMAHADPTTFSDALAIIQNYGLYHKTPASILQRLNDGAEGLIAETPKPGHRIFKNVSHHVLASNGIALTAAANKAREMGYDIVIYPQLLTGEAKEMARKFLTDAYSKAINKPTCYIAGGETTVTIKGKGKGGRNQEFALSAFIWLEEQNTEHWPVLLAAGTDGTDGPTDAAGAIVSPGILQISKAKALDPGYFLENNDAYNFFDACGGLVKTGATQTNVMDLVIMIRMPDTSQ